MARALLREHQIGDRDNLSEDEHDVLVHENLVTSGTLNFQDGTISGTGDVYATTYYGDGSQLTGVSGGGSSTPSTLYYNGTDVRATATSTGFEANYGSAKTLATNNIGISVGSFAQGSTGVLNVNASKLMTLRNDNTGGLMEITGRQAGGSYVDMINLNPDGAASLYHAGTKILNTATKGITVGDGTDTFDMQYITTTGNFVFDNQNHGGAVIFRGENNAGDQKDLAQFDPDGGGSVNYAGVPAITTIARGVSIQDTGTGDDCEVVYDGAGNFLIYNKNHGGAVQLQGENTAGNAVEPIFKGDPDGASELYYAGVKALESAADGINVFDTSGDDPRIHFHSDVPADTGNYIGTDGTAMVCNTGASFKWWLSGANVANMGAGYINFYDSAASNYFQTTWNVTDVRLTNFATSGKIEIRGRNSVPTTTDMAVFDPDGSVELYYAGAKTYYQTANNHYFARSADTAKEANINISSAGTVNFRNETAGASLTLSNRNSGDTAYETILLGTNAGATALYHAGAKVFETTAAGARIGDIAGGDYFEINEGTNWALISRKHGASVYIQGENTATGAVKSLVVGDPDGAAELYYAGDKKLETTVSGINVIDTITQNGERLYTQSEVDTLITTVSGALQAQIDNLGALLI